MDNGSTYRGEATPQNTLFFVFKKRPNTTTMHIISSCCKLNISEALLSLAASNRLHICRSASSFIRELIAFAANHDSLHWSINCEEKMVCCVPYHCNPTHHTTNTILQPYPTYEVLWYTTHPHTHHPKETYHLSGTLLAVKVHLVACQSLPIPLFLAMSHVKTSAPPTTLLIALSRTIKVYWSFVSAP